MRAKTYMGGPCKRGHSGERFTRNRSCVTCERDKLACPDYKARKAALARAYRMTPEGQARTAESYRLTRYGMTPTEYNFMLAGQGYRCASCLSDDHNGHNWHVDHCHDTGIVRGILCANCNPGLGHFKHSPERLQAAIEYLCKTKNSTKPTSAMAGPLTRSPHTEPNESKHTNWSAGLL